MFRCNVLMCVDVAALLPPSHINITHNWLRCAGSTGTQTVKELVAYGLVPISVECGNGPVPIQLKDDDSESTRSLIAQPLPTFIQSTHPIDSDNISCEQLLGRHTTSIHFPKVFTISAELLFRSISPWNDIISKDGIGDQPSSLNTPASLLFDPSGPSSSVGRGVSELRIHRWLPSTAVVDECRTHQQRLNHTVRNLQPIHVVLGEIEIVKQREIGTEAVITTTTNNGPITFNNTPTAITTNTIPHAFLERCTSISSIDLQPISTVITHIQDKFLSGCYGLKSLDFTSLRSVTHIGDEFLGGCAGLQNVDMTMMNRVVSIGMSFMANCTGVRDVKVSRAIAHSSVRSYGFLQQCSCLSTISLQPFEGVSAIPHAFLTQCSFLREIDLTPLLLQPQQHPPPSSSLPITPMTTTSVLLLHRVHSNCLSYCTRLKTINLSALRNVVQIGDNFLFGSLSLSEIDLKALGNVEVIGKRFLGDCVGLAFIDLTPLTSIISIDQGLMSGCVGIINVRISAGTRAGTMTAAALPVALISDERVTIDWIH